MKRIEETDTRHSALLDRKYREFFIPTILMAMTLTMSIVVDSIIVGNMLGATALAAVNLVLPVVMVYNTVAVCLGLGAATHISIAKGKREPDYANAVFTVVIFGLLAGGFLLLACQSGFLDNIVQLLAREESLRPLVKSYLHVLVWGTPIIILVPGLAYCLRVDSQVKLASAVLIISNLVNLALDLIYMGPLKLGIAGSSLATVSGYITGGLCLLPYVFNQKRTLRFQAALAAAPAQIIRLLGKIVKTGFPAAMGSILITFKILCVNHIVLAVAGESALIAFSICLSCLSFVSMFISGAAQAMTPIVGVLYGEKDYRGVYFVIRRALITLLAASIVSTLLIETMPAQILGIFGVRDAADIAAGVPAIRLFSLSLIGTSITFLSMYYYLTIGLTKLSTAISFVQGAGVVPLAIVMAEIMGISGVWIAFPLAELVTIAMIAGCYVVMRRKHPQKYNSLLLLDQQQVPSGHRLETTSSNREKAIDDTKKLLSSFSSAAGLKPETVKTILQAITTTASTVFSRPATNGKEQYFDILLNVLDTKITISMRDNVTHFPQAAGERLKEALSETCQVQYAQAIGFNNFTMTFDRPQPDQYETLSIEKENHGPML
jgi:Na+-driven multidrug efflux pump